jgi:sulfatase modifying factor 1
MKIALGLVLVLVSAVAACAPDHTPIGGLVVVMELDSTLASVNLTGLHITVRSAGDGGLDRDETYPLSMSPAAGGGGAISFPATMPIESNGNPLASVIIDLVLWQGAGAFATPVDFREYEIVDLPTDGFTELVVVFGAACTSTVTLADGQAVSLCPAGETCAGAPTGACVSNVVSGGSLPPYAGQPPSSSVPGDAGGDATVANGPEAGPDVVPPPDATVDALSPIAPDAGPDIDAVADSGPEDPDTGFSPEIDAAPLTCASACVEGSTHCVDGQCVPVPPSCMGTDPGVGYNCGGWAGTDDCCATLDVAGGSFYRDYDSVNVGAGKNDPATVSTFSLDVYEVSVGRFRKFVSASVGDGGAGWIPPPGSGKHAYLNDGGGLVNGGGGSVVYETGWDRSWTAMYLPSTKDAWDTSLLSPDCSGDAGPPTNTWTSTPTSDGYENFPIDCVTWYQAYAFCIWDGGFLPSSTEWNRAAAPPDTQTGQRIYAWGSNNPQPDCKLAIWGDDYGGGSFSPQGAAIGVANIAPVGSAPAGRALWGQLDLTGNLWEWTLDYDTGVYENPCVDCADTASGTQRLARGGAYEDGLMFLINSFKAERLPTVGDPDTGFRCARAP